MSTPALRAAQAAVLLAFGLMVTGEAVAQSAQPQLPPGISIGPRPPAEAGAGANAPVGGGETQDAQGVQQSPQPQDGPGCVYRGNKLELIV